MQLFVAFLLGSLACLLLVVRAESAVRADSAITEAFPALVPCGALDNCTNPHTTGQTEFERENFDSEDEQAMHDALIFMDFAKGYLEKEPPILIRALNMHLTAWELLGDRADLIKTTMKNANCDEVTTVCGRFLLLEDLRRMYIQGMSRVSPSSLILSGDLEGYDDIFGTHEPSCPTEGKGSQTRFHRDLQLQGPQLRILPQLWEYPSEDKPHIEMYHNILGPVAWDPKNGRKFPVFICVYRRHVRCDADAARIHLGFVELRQAFNDDEFLQNQGSDGTGRLHGLQFLPVSLFGDSAQPSVVMKGQNPRVFMHNNRIHIYAELLPPERTRSESMPHGKNWVPFSHAGVLHFIYLFEPLLVMRCEDLELRPRPVQCQCHWMEPPHGYSHAAAGSEGHRVGIFRGGSAGLTFLNQEGGSDIVVGMGHTTFTSYTHAPFIFRLNLDTLHLDISILPPHLPISPSRGFPVFDPTSLFVVNDRFYTAATVRRHPDFTSFEQRHSETVVFEISAQLLPNLSDVKYRQLYS
ncbi:hypothetical protein CYMTET_47186 [Cymbomonas tetramitiformis]|uniref:Uncharacterized protein n=1 Tax=Cymbomonas tetramitiformis TaxID=36881 RepID=A0AAE0BVV7_9CHLO|nr:hypothetical protein CYMTET_47186 [Cymbomonas tetramitiformis]